MQGDEVPITRRKPREAERRARRIGDAPRRAQRGPRRTQETFAYSI